MMPDDDDDAAAASVMSLRLQTHQLNALLIRADGLRRHLAGLQEATQSFVQPRLLQGQRDRLQLRCLELLLGMVQQHLAAPLDCQKKEKR